MLSAAELAGMQADARAWLPQTCRLWRLTRTHDEYGGQGEAYALAAADVPCRLANAARADAETTSEGREITSSSWILTLPHDAEVLSTDRIECNGLMLEITFLDRGRADAVSLRVQCREVE